MKTKSRNLFLLILTFVMAISCMGLVGGVVYAEPQEVTPKFEMLGASIRLDEPTGIRFAAKVDGEKYSQVISGEDTLFGAIIVPKDILGDITISKDNNHVKALAGKTYLDSIKNYSQGLLGKVEKDAQDNPTGYYTVNYSISNVKYGNYNREFFGLVYIRSGVEGSYTYEYATIENVVNERTVADVAKAYYPIAEDTDTTVLENFIYKAEFLANDTESGDYQTSETNASAYIIEQKAKIEEFDSVATATIAKQSSINVAMEKYNALGEFAKTVVSESKALVDEKQATLCTQIKDEITTLAQKTVLTESDYHKIYGLKSSYTALPEESKELVDNYSDLVDVENKFLKNYDVQVVFGATEEEGGDAIVTSGQHSNTGVLLSYDINEIYGPFVKIVNGKDYEQRIASIIKKNASTNYSGYKLCFNAFASNYSYFHYINSSIAWAVKEDSVNKNWVQFAYDAEMFGVYNGGRQVGFNLIKSTDTSTSYFMMSAVFAIKLSEVGQINAKIAELNNKETLEPSDYHVIYGLKTNYEVLSVEEQGKVDYDVLLGIETKFLESYDVKVVYTASETGATVSASGNNSGSVSKAYGRDFIFGSTLTITNGNSNNQRAYGNISFTRNNYVDYTIYFNVKANVACEFYTLNSSAAYSTLATVNANEWTTVSVESSSLLSNALYMGLYNSAKLSVGSNITVSAVFAIKAK